MTSCTNADTLHFLCISPCACTLQLVIFIPKYQCWFLNHDIGDHYSPHLLIL